MKGAKIHAPPGTLPWEPRYLLRPFTPTGEAAGAAQPPPPPGPSGGRGRGRPKSAAKCDPCRRKGRDCGLSCPDWPGHQPNAQTATPTQLPALAAAAMPLLETPGSGAAASSSGPHPPLADGAEAAATTDENVQARTPPLPPVVAVGAASAEAAAQRASSSRGMKPRDLESEEPEWTVRKRDRESEAYYLRQQRRRSAAGGGLALEGEEDEVLTSPRARARARA
jgi:hypothetical protein